MRRKKRRMRKRRKKRRKSRRRGRRRGEGKGRVVGEEIFTDPSKAREAAIAELLTQCQVPCC